MLKFELTQALKRAKREGRQEDAEEIKLLLGQMDDSVEPERPALEYMLQEGDDPFSIAEEQLGSIEFVPDFLAENPGLWGIKPGTYVNLPRVGRLADPAEPPGLPEPPEPEGNAATLVDLFETKGAPGANWTPDDWAVIDAVRAEIEAGQTPANNGGGEDPAMEQAAAAAADETPEAESDQAEAANEELPPEIADIQLPEDQAEAIAQYFAQLILSGELGDPTTWSPERVGMPEGEPRQKPAEQGGTGGDGGGESGSGSEDQDYLSWEDRQRAAQQAWLDVQVFGNGPAAIPEGLTEADEEGKNLFPGYQDAYDTYLVRENLAQLMSNEGIRIDLYTKLQLIKEEAEAVRLAVSANSPLGDIPTPVAAFADLLDRAWEEVDGDPDQFMWIATNVLLGADAFENPNVFLVGTANVDVFGERPLEEYCAADNPNFVELLLPYGNPVNSQFSELGDWKPELFDGTSNQAFHFWNYTAISFYNSAAIAEIGDAIHDPVGIDPTLLSALQQIPLVRKLTGGQVSQEDANLSAQGFLLGDLLRNYSVGNEGIPENWSPGEWVRDHLANEN